MAIRLGSKAAAPRLRVRLKTELGAVTRTTKIRTGPDDNVTNGKVELCNVKVD